MKWSNAQKQKRRLYWQDVWKLHCGCALCGYNKHPKALSFDHVNHAQKHRLVKNGTGKTRAGGMWQLTNPKNATIAEMVAEWRKCRVLCMNCHMEQKYSYWHKKFYCSYERSDLFGSTSTYKEKLL